jgi:TolA-binding protein
VLVVIFFIDTEMPSLRKYNSGSIIYFDKDVSDEIFLLKSGKVLIKFISEDTGEEISKPARPGEIFGLKSAIIGVPRGETAIAAEPSEVVVFTTREFEIFASNNPEVLFKTLKALSNQLRNIGIKVNNLLSNNTIVPPDVGMLKIGEYFLTSKKYEQAIQVFEKFLKTYPNSSLVNEAKRYIEIAKKAKETGVLDKIPSLGTTNKNNHVTADDITFDGTISSVMNAIYLAENMYNRGEYSEALKVIEKLMLSGVNTSNDLFEKVLSIKAKILMKLKKFDEAIATYKEIIDKFPNSKQIKLSLFGMASAFIEKGDKNNGIMILRKVASMPPFDEISQKAQEVANKLNLL